jgi:hypothetical protein
MIYRTAVSALVLLVPVLALAQGPPCRPCAGIAATDPQALLTELTAEPALTDQARLYVRWPVSTSADGEAARLAHRVAQTGATPWLAITFSAAAPLAEHGDALDAELSGLAALAAAVPANTHFQILWEPSGGSWSPEDYAFLVKRAAVAVTGARPLRVITEPLPHSRPTLQALYDAGLAAYVDGVALEGAADDVLAASVAWMAELDPGRPVIVDCLPFPDAPAQSLLISARHAELGIAITFFAVKTGEEPDLAPLKVLARELSGDLAFDPYSTPSGVAAAWSFVRGDDLGLRVIADTSQTPDSAEIVFADSSLEAPTRVGLDGQPHPLYARGTRRGLAMTVDKPDPVTILRLDRRSFSEIGGFADEVTVAGQHEMPVAEILRRLQAFEDAQARRLHSYEAINQTHLRFRPGEAIQTIEASFEGPLFFRQGRGFDWQWQSMLINGVRWHGKIPELPLIQPAKAAALPLEIHLTKEYQYRLKGTATVDGRDCWVVEFEPAAATPGRNLYRGTVWVDREIFARVKSQALQEGLEGEVISNEETQYFRPVDENGQPAEWRTTSFILPTRIVGRELQSILNAAVQVEKETLLTEIRINREGFADRLEQAHASTSTMVRDTPQGLRYLERKPDGTREVQEGFDNDRLFGLAGTYYDESLDYPLPLLGLNYFSRDFRGRGQQLNIFFAGVFANANFAEPQLAGSAWDAGARFFGFFVPVDEVLYRDGHKVDSETVSHQPAQLSLFLGRPIGSYGKLELSYDLLYDSYGRADDTEELFVVPDDTLTHAFGAELTYTRGGYRLALEGTRFDRQDWAPWGPPDSIDYDPAHKDYLKWQLTLAKTWWLGGFTKLGARLEHLDGSDLDRFSKYGFSFFSSSRVSGYPSGLVTAAEVDGLHLTYGLSLADVLRVELRGDAVWATDELTALDRELLAGLSLNGTLIGPWQTIVNFDIGVPVEGPADGVVVSLVFLKLF